MLAFERHIDDLSAIIASTEEEAASTGALVEELEAHSMHPMSEVMWQTAEAESHGFMFFGLLAWPPMLQSNISRPRSSRRQPPREAALAAALIKTVECR